MELDNEVKGTGNSYTTEFRQYDPRLGRWLSLDPMASSAAGWSPYRAFFDNPIIFSDPLGLFEKKSEAKEEKDRQVKEGLKCGRIKHDKIHGYYFKSVSGDPKKGDSFTFLNYYKVKEENSIDDKSQIAFVGLSGAFAEATAIARGTATVSSEVLAIKPIPFLNGSLLAPLFIPSDTGPKVMPVIETEHFKVTRYLDDFTISPKGGHAVTPLEKEIMKQAEFLFERGSGGSTDVYMRTALKTGKYYDCAACILCKGEKVVLKVNEIYKFGISQDISTRYSKYENTFLRTTELVRNVPRDAARAIEKLLILDYSMGGFGNQREKLEKRGIFTTYGKPIGNPYFR